MNTFRIGLLAVAAVVSATAAQAQSNTTNSYDGNGSVTQLNTGGASLPSPAFRNLFNCFGLPTDGTTTLPTGCTARARTDISINQGSVGSGGGQRAFYSHSRAQLGSGQPAGPLHIGHSDAALTQAQIALYDNPAGGSGSPLSSGQSLAAAGVAPSGATQFANPRASYGPMIQIPALGTAITIAYDPVYMMRRSAGGSVVRYRFNVQNFRSTGGLRLDAQAYCQIFAGQITNWNDPKLTALNNGVSLKALNDSTPAASWSLPIKLAVRDDNSGTTALFTRHLRAVCEPHWGPTVTAAILNASNPSNLSGGFSQGFPGMATNSSGTTGTCVASTNAFLAGTWMRGRGNEGVANCVGGNGTDIPLPPPTVSGAALTVKNGVIGYLAPDYVLPAVTVSNPPFAPLGLHTANLKNAAGNFIEPKTSAIQLALGALPPPTTTIDRANPFKWVGRPEGIFDEGGGPVVNPLANPPASIPLAYPIVGTTNFMVYTCYASNTVRTLIANNTTSVATQGYLNWFYKRPTSVNTIALASGLVPMPTATRLAIQTHFLNGGTSALRIRTAPAGGVCTDGA